MLFQALDTIENSILAYSQAFNILAGDIQNFQTSGYKQSQYSFVSLFSLSMQRYGGGLGGAALRGRENTQNIAMGVSLIPFGIDFTQGGFNPGGRLNAGISGSSFFMLKPEDANRDFALTRASDFLFSADGSLVDGFGRQVMGYQMVNGEPDKSTMVPIQVDPEEIDLLDLGFEDGGILTTNYAARNEALEQGGDAVLPEGQPLFQLALARVANPSGLETDSGNSFRVTLNSGEIFRRGVAGDEGMGSVTGGVTEGSNVDPSETTIIGIELQRGYNAVQGTLTFINKFLTTFQSAIDKVIG